MAEQQLTQEELGQEQQVFDSLPPVVPGPEPENTITPGPAIVPKQDMFGSTEQQLRPTAVKEQKVLPKEKERQPIFLGDLSQAEETFKNYATFDKAEKAKPVVSGGMIGGMGGFTAQNVFPTQADADAYMAGVRQNKAKANVLKSQTIKQLTDSKSTQKLSDFIFGSTEDIIKQGGNVSKFIIKNSAGQDIIDPGKVRQEIDKVITAKGNNGGRYMREFFASKITSDDNLDMILSVYKNRDKINKAMPTGVSKKEVDGFLTEKKAEMAPKLQSQIKVQDSLLSEKVENIKSKYSTELTDAGVDLNVYYTAAQNDVAKEVPELTMSADPATQAIFARRVEDRFNQQYAQYVMPKLQDITDRMAAEIKTEVSNVNSAIKRIYKENNAVLQREYQGWLQTRNKELSDKFNQTAGQIILDGVTQKRNEAKAYAENMLDMSTRADVLGAVSIGKILGDTFTASAGGFKNKTALIMNALGFEADWIDEMRYSGKSQEVQFSMEKLPLEQNWMKPGYWAQSLAQSAPTMALGMATTALTGNPYVGGIVSFMTESMENSGGVMERVLANTGDLDAANLAGGQTFIKNVPTVVSDILFQRMFSPLKIAKGTTKEKVRDLGVSMFAEGFTEAWNSASEMSSGVDAKMGFGRAFVSRDARNAAIEGAVSAGALGGAGVTVTGAYKALFDKKNIPSIRTQAIANTILANGETAAVAGVQLDALANEADDDALNEGLKEVADVAKLISDAQQVGLTPQQTQVFVSMSKELADIKANLATITDPTARKIIENQISAKEKEVDGIVSGKTPIATIELQPGLVFTGTVDGVRNVMNVPEVKAEVEAGSVNIITDDQAFNTEVEQIKAVAPTRQRNIISDTGEVVGQVPAEAAPVAEAAPTATVEDIERRRQEEIRKLPEGTKSSLKPLLDEINAKYDAELASLQTIKTQEDATKISERAQQEVPQPSNLVQREGTQEGQPQVGQAEGAVGQATQPAADTRNRNLGSQAQEIQIAANALALEDKSFDELQQVYDKLSESTNEDVKALSLLVENVQEKKERNSILNTPLENVSNVIDGILQKEGFFLEQREAVEAKAVADKYSKEVTVEDARRDFKDAFFGRPESWVADALKMRESARVVIENGGTFKDLLSSVQKEFEADSFTEQDAAGVIKSKIEAITKKDFRQNQIAEQYAKAKSDGINPELVKAVEDLIGKPSAPTAEAAPVSEAPMQVDELLIVDTKVPTNLEKVFNFLDGIDKAIGKELNSGKLSDATRVIPLAAIQTMVKALKTLVQGGMALQDAIRKVAADNNYQEKDVTDAMKKVVEIETATEPAPTTAEPIKIEQAAPSPGAGKLLGPLKDIKKITMTEKAALEKQIKDLARGAKDAITAWRNASSVLGKDIKDMARKGQITAKQAGNIIKKFGKINILSPKAVSKFVDYMTKVFSDAEYQNKLDGARSLKKDIAKLAKGKDRDARLKDIGKRFLKVEPTEVEDIDEYNRIAEQLKESLRGTKRTKTGIELASIINIDDVGGYIQKAIDAQDIKMREDTAKEFQELFGVDPAEFSYDDMLELMETKGEVPKKNEAVIRSAINKAFGIYSTVIKKTIANGVDPFTEAPVEISESKKELLQRFMNMDLGRLDIKLAMQAVDALNNFVTNKSIAKMDAVVNQYEGGLGAKQVNDKNIKSFPLKKLFSANLGRAFGEYTTNLGALFERMFKGVTRGGFVETKSGISRIKRGKATAETRANGMAKDYVTDFYKKGKYGVMLKNVNGEEFNTLKNNLERGAIAFLSRNVIGTKAQREAEFNRRKRHFLQSIDALMGGTEKEKKLGEAYKEIADKFGISEATDALSIFSKADENNQKGINFWREKWDSVFDELAEVSEGIYNKILSKDTDYIPDRYKRLTGQPKQEELSITESAFHYNSEGDIYKKEAGVLMKAERPDDLPPGTYIDLSFDNNNASAMYDALVDIHTAAAIRQWEGFSKSPEFNQIINAEDRDLFRGRIGLYIKAIRNKAPYVNDELEKGLRRINVLTSVGVGQALAGLATPFKQTLGVIPNTLINAGRVDLKALSDKNKNDFINRSGYSIANRGVESQAQLDSLNRIIEIAATSTPEKALKIIEKANNFYLKTLLVNRDAWVARISWLAYYEQSLENQGIDPAGIDWATHQINEEAGDYAQRMVDRQQNISDPAEAGKMFVGSESSIQKLVVRMAMPFASFRMNQSTRLANDLSVLGYWSTSTKEDRIIAARSLAGLAAEMVTFRLVSIGAALAVGYASYAVMGDEPDEEELQKWKDNIYRGQVTNTVNDILSPLPVTDKIVQEGVFAVTDDIQTIAGISDEEKVNIFQPKATEYLEGLGLFGITAQRGKQMIDITSLAILDNGFEDKFGNERFLLEKDKEVLSVLLAPALLSSIGALPSEFNSIVRKSLNDAKKRALTEKQMRAGGKKKRGGGGGEEGFGGEGFGGGDGFGGGGF